MRIQRLLAAAFCATGLACSSEPGLGPDTLDFQGATERLVLYGVVIVNGDGPPATVTLSTIDGPHVRLVGDAVNELRKIAGAFVIVHGKTVNPNSTLSVFEVDHYEVLKEPSDDLP